MEIASRRNPNLLRMEGSSIFCGFIAQLVRASHRYREVMGSNPVEALNFSGLQAIAEIAIHCDDQS